VGELRGDVEVHPQDTVGDRVSLSGSAGYDGVCHRAEGHGRGKSSGAHPTPSCTPSVELHDLATEDPHNRLIKLLLGAPSVSKGPRRPFVSWKSTSSRRPRPTASSPPATTARRSSTSVRLAGPASS